MGEKPDEIKNDIEQARSRLGQNLNELEYRVRSTADWRAHFDKHPWTFMGVAFVGSMLVSMMIARR
jgi:ElaB/YqjD/DUF883 family membrane-anchored ribosome-binding protein